MAKKEVEKLEKVIKENEPLSDSKKIDLYINDQEDLEQGISIMNIFSILAKRFKIYLWVMIIGLLAGLLVPTLMYTFKDKKDTAISILGLDYAGAEVGNDPAGNKLDISYLKSTYIVNNALNSVTLSKKLSTAQVQNNLVITGILSDETRQQQDILDKLAADKSSEYGKMLQEFTLKYRPQYIISLDSVFKDGNTKVVLPSNELQRLLSAITSAYNDYFVETYQDRNLPSDYLSAINENALDYLEILDNISSFLDYLVEYCDEKEALLPNYKTKDGVSFADLSNIITTLKNTNIDYAYSYVFLNNVYKNKATLQIHYENQKKDAESSLDEINANIATLQNSINSYKNGKVVVNTDSGTPVEVPHTDAEYNRLVLELSEMNEEKSSLQERISLLNARIDKLSGPEATEEQKQEAATFVSKALSDAKDIYSLVNKNTNELINSNAFKNRYMHAITTSDSETFFDNIKTFLIGVGAGLGISVVIWIVDAFIIELRNVRKANELREEE